ncbi:hypothetical protein [Marilutibacter aestuarii]|uniref:Uncharacterized protein n=1 Tax=Marilutibacter aestuarii TaxID=1706195 RepID=A0A508AN52_9GAMM|nr:hypothetical protein [Lysobacter aestuarii]TQD51386.1 hypothetical protein FKV25_01300 [Lysobacter aestuarii]
MHTVHARRPTPRATPSRVHPLLDEVLRAAVAIGALLLLMVPEARGSHPQLGWLPLWLLGMPLVAWWAAHRFRLPGRRASPPPAVRGSRRRLPQARRRDPVLSRTRRPAPRLAA